LRYIYLNTTPVSGLTAKLFLTHVGYEAVQTVLHYKGPVPAGFILPYKHLMLCQVVRREQPFQLVKLNFGER